MKSINLFENWNFDSKGPHADPLYVDPYGRAILFTLKPGQPFANIVFQALPFMQLFSVEKVFLLEETASNERLNQTHCLFLTQVNHTVYTPWMNLFLLVSCMVRPELK